MANSSSEHFVVVVEHIFSEGENLASRSDRKVRMVCMLCALRPSSCIQSNFERVGAVVIEQKRRLETCAGLGPSTRALGCRPSPWGRTPQATAALGESKQENSLTRRKGRRSCMSLERLRGNRRSLLGKILRLH